MVVYFRKEPIPDLWPARETPPCVGEQACRGVAAGEEDVKQLTAQDVRILSLRNERVQEDVALRFLILLPPDGGVGVTRNRFGDVVVGKLVHRLYAFGSPAVRNQAGEAADLSLNGHGFGRVDKASRKGVSRCLERFAQM